MTDYLVDNSVWVRFGCGDENARSRMRQIERTPADLFVTCPPQVLECCHSARTPLEHALLREQMAFGFPLEKSPDEDLVVEIQQALWNAGLVRAAGPIDILIAAYAMVNDATVLAADRDFSHIASVVDLQYEYIAPSA